MRPLLLRLLQAIHPLRVESDLAREIASHLALHRDARSIVWIDDLRRDLLEDDFQRRGMTVEHD